jgi:plastocyanin
MRREAFIMKGFFVLLAVASLVGCGGGGGSGSTSPNPNPPVNTTPPVGGISVTNDAFSPATKTVSVGTSVQWAWNSCTGGDPYGGGGATCVEHSVTFDDGSSSSALQGQGTFSKTFNTAGTYTYHCQIHGTMGMTGTITVQ